LEFKNELYLNFAPMGSRKKLLRECGLGKASNGVVLIVRGIDLAVMNDRSDIRINGNKIPIERLCQTISSDLPSEIEDYSSQLVSNSDLSKVITRSHRQWLKETYNNHLISDKAVVTSSKDILNLNTETAKIDKEKNGNTNPSGDGQVIPFAKPNESKPSSKRRKFRQLINSGKIPQIVEDDTLPTNIWCDLSIEQNRLSYNPNFEKIENYCNMKTIVKDSMSKEAKQKAVQGMLIVKTIQYIYHTIHFNRKEPDAVIRAKLKNTILTEQAWVSKADASNFNRSDTMR
jgi:hypothetical protein